MELPKLPPISEAQQKMVDAPAFVDVERIARSAGQNLDRDSIPEFVEAPLVDAVTLLYDKGVRTNSSSANPESSENAYIDLDFSTLSGVNKKIVGELMELAEARAEEYPQRMELLEPDPNTGSQLLHVTMPLEGQTPEAVGDFYTTLGKVFESQTSGINSGEV